jgi:WD40 repeat protein
VLFAFCLFPSNLWPQDSPSYEKDVVPIISASCIGCHTAGVKLGGLDLSTFDALQKGGNHGAVLAPGKSAESRLYLMVAGKMQPSMPLGQKALAAGEIEIIRKWIDAGARPPAPGAGAVTTAAAIPDIKPRHAVKFQIFSMAHRPDGKMLALGGYKEVRLVEAATGRVLATLPGHADTIRSLAFSKDGRYLAAAGGLPARQGEVKIWDVEARSEARALEGHSDSIYAVAFSPDGQSVATASYDKLIKVWDAASGGEVRTLKDHIDAIYALAFAPDGKRLVSAAADRSVKVWNPATGERLYTLSDAIDGLNTLALDPNGTRVAAGGLDKTIRVWSLGEKGGTLLASLIAHEDAILKIAWSPDGSTLVSAAADKTVKVFKADDLTEIKALVGQPDWVNAVDFAPDGKTLAAGRFDGSLSLYGTSDWRDTLAAQRASK